MWETYPYISEKSPDAAEISLGDIRVGARVTCEIVTKAVKTPVS